MISFVEPFCNDSFLREAAVYSVVGAQRVRAIAGLSKRVTIHCNNQKVVLHSCFLTRIG
jgi:hypothetical protein